MTALTLAVTQMACSWDLPANLDTAEALVRRAAAQGAKLILLPELFETPYFCPEQKPQYFELARPFAGNPVISRFQALARELGVVLPVSFFEKANQSFFNSVTVIDADGAVRGLYRKSHIPDGPGYQEKYYFSPGDTGFRVWETAVGTIGVGICWDQWFPEAARAMVLMGADVLLYPTAIGSEPTAPDTDSQPHWCRTMQGHAAANMAVVAASNRIGTEQWDSCALTFYGTSFIADETGGLLTQAGRTEAGVLTATVDLDAIRRRRFGWGLFRDRRPSLYGPLMGFG